MYFPSTAVGGLPGLHASPRATVGPVADLVRTASFRFIVCQWRRVFLDRLYVCGVTATERRSRGYTFALTTPHRAVDFRQ